MNNAFIVLVGESGSGKTTIANILENKYWLKQVQSYTERPKRYDEETGHTFITPIEFDQLKDIVAYTCYNRYRYCTTKNQIEQCDIAVIDVPGVMDIRRFYKGDKRICVFYINVSEKRRFWRMLKRGDSVKSAIGRIRYDRIAFQNAKYVCDFTIKNRNAEDAADLIMKMIEDSDYEKDGNSM